MDILTEADFAGNLVVLEPGKIRIRRAGNLRDTH